MDKFATRGEWVNENSNLYLKGEVGWPLSCLSSHGDVDCSRHRTDALHGLTDNPEKIQAFI